MERITITLEPHESKRLRSEAKRKNLNISQYSRLLMFSYWRKAEIEEVQQLTEAGRYRDIRKMMDTPAYVEKRIMRDIKDEKLRKAKTKRKRRSR